jgi:hypothetical protein
MTYVSLQWWRRQEVSFYQTTRYYVLWRHSGVSWTLWSRLSRWPALCATHSSTVSHTQQPTQSCSVLQPSPLLPTVSSQSQQKLAAQSSRFRVSLLSRLFFISVIIYFLLICYISLFYLFLFVSAFLCNSLPWLIYFSFFISLFPYLSAYFFLHLFMSLSLYFFSFSFFFSSLIFMSLFLIFFFPLYSFFALCCIPV